MELSILHAKDPVACSPPAPVSPAMQAPSMTCRANCAACCIAPSISSAIQGMPDGKPAGVRCVQLTDSLQCALFGQPERPAVCVSLRPSIEMCGSEPVHALRWLQALELQTAPTVPHRPAIAESA